MKALSALLLLVPPAFASLISDPVPTITSVCMVSGLPVTCGTFSSPNIYGTEHVGTDTSISITGIGANTGLTIIASADSTSGTVGFGRGDSSAVATLSLHFLGFSTGPVRQGFATYLTATDVERGGGTGASAFDSIAGLGSCQFAVCVSRGTLVPFELGVPFEIALSLYSDSGFGSHAFTGSSSWAEIQLQLFDADGSAVTIFDPPAADVPEPGAGILSALGLITLLAFPAKARLASTRHKLKP